MKVEQLEKIKKHGENLNKIFNTGVDPVLLCKKLRRLELKGNNKATQWCNGDIDGERWEEFCKNYVEPKLLILLFQGKPKIKLNDIYLNSDARGYFLKLNDETSKIFLDKIPGLCRDWGNNVILAPEIN